MWHQRGTSAATCPPCAVAAAPRLAGVGKPLYDVVSILDPGRLPPAPVVFLHRSLDASRGIARGNLTPGAPMPNGTVEFDVELAANGKSALANLKAL
jgi:hypothetical protein